MKLNSQKRKNRHKNLISSEKYHLNFENRWKNENLRLGLTKINFQQAKNPKLNNLGLSTWF